MTTGPGFGNSVAGSGSVGHGQAWLLSLSILDPAEKVVSKK